jgi:hypothetical protein
MPEPAAASTRLPLDETTEVRLDIVWLKEVIIVPKPNIVLRVQ